MKACPACGREYPNTMTLCSVDAAVLQSVSDPRLGTAPGVSASAGADDLDEETVVRPRSEAPLDAPAGAPDSLASFSPWRIIIPSAIVLVVVFGVVFLLTRSTGQTPPKQTTQGQTQLAADPNSQPVQSWSPPTGASEREIRSLPGASPVASASTNANLNQRPSPPDVLGNYAANANGNDNASERGNKNANQTRESPTPKSSPSISIKTETPPPPKPLPSAAVSKPTTTPPGELR